MTRWHGLVRGAVLGVLLGAAAGAAHAGGVDAPWGVGWDDGLTLRWWPRADWELSLSAGPDDRLDKEEQRASLLARPSLLQGALEVPLDERREQGWVRLQAGRRLATRDALQLVGFAGLTYNWIDAQERVLTLDELAGDYDTWESDRFTGRWLLELGVRPAWRPAPHLSLETAFGLRFTWEHWDQSVVRTYAGVPGADRTDTDGHARGFTDLGWDGFSSLQIIFWF